MRSLLIFFILVPLLEMFLLIQVGSLIGALPTIGLVILTATVGIHLIRQQGFSILSRYQQKLAGGQMPGNELIEGLMLAFGGALLLTPGFFTDAIGFAMVIPVTRQKIASYMKSRIKIATPVFTNPSANQTDSPHRSDQGNIIDGEFKELDR
ncbi:FxsA family protein [Pelagibaculum spongiae]|uniref:Exlusion protein FxsA n=1 Tax=Pelagibaculum spongiae TaxID=2080658 RepID=A0A2V1GNC4_9GAMM|nr:FxsA family protein [Pelagibaculum spongiae]PVZ62942.1 hypothetical protein DC094_21480 [Pelagibaculum spongiae]